MTLTCGNCATPLSTSGEECPKCGRRTFVVNLQAESRVHVWLGAKHKRPGIRGYITELKTGWEPTKAIGGRVIGYVQKFWMIEKLADRYREKITSEDGTILRDVDEPLSKHRGFGSAKYKKPEESK